MLQTLVVALGLLSSCIQSLPVIATVGDSLTEYGGFVEDSGWVWMLEKDYDQKATVLNFGKAGWNTRMWGPEVSKVIDATRASSPVLFTVFLGANDAALEKYDPPSVPLPEYTNNLRSIIQKIQLAFPSASILIITPPSVDDVLLAAFRTNSRVGLYASACVALGKELGLPVLDLWTPTQDRLDLLKDGLHFNKDGNIFVHELVADAIQEAFPMLQPLTITVFGDRDLSFDNQTTLYYPELYPYGTILIGGAAVMSTGKKGIWTEHVDEASGRKFYYNMVHGRSYWEIPDEFKESIMRPLVDASTQAEDSHKAEEEAMGESAGQVQEESSHASSIHHPDSIEARIQQAMKHQQAKQRNDHP